MHCCATSRRISGRWRCREFHPRWRRSPSSSTSPTAEISGFQDPRHHAVSLAFVVPVSGDCQPTQEALDLRWFTPAEAVSEEVRREMTGGHDRLIRLASPSPTSVAS
jgi:hypothetical protein